MPAIIARRSWLQRQGALRRHVGMQDGGGPRGIALDDNRVTGLVRCCAIQKRHHDASNLTWLGQHMARILWNMPDSERWRMRERFGKVRVCSSSAMDLQGRLLGSEI